jgi:hypothetical protein
VSEWSEDVKREANSLETSNARANGLETSNARANGLKTSNARANGLKADGRKTSSARANVPNRGEWSGDVKREANGPKTPIAAIGPKTQMRGNRFNSPSGLSCYSPPNARGSNAADSRDRDSGRDCFDETANSAGQEAASNGVDCLDIAQIPRRL